MVNRQRERMSMKRWQKLLLILLVLILLSQGPFVYRRYQLGRLNAAIQKVNSDRRTEPSQTGYREFIGVSHVHSFLGGHSKGTLQEIIDAASANRLDFVLMTEHPALNFNTAEKTLHGRHGGVLFVNGNEVRTRTGDRLLLVPGDGQANKDSQSSTPEVLSRRNGSVQFVAYPEEFQSWEATGYNGVEVFNLYTNARQINRLVMFFDSLWSYRSNPDLLFATFYERPAPGLQKWDEAIARKRGKLVAISGNDAHSNVGVSLNDSSGNRLLGLTLDPYERSFRLVRLHIFAAPSAPMEVPQLDEESLLKAISSGHCFIGFDVLGDTTGFRFTAQDADENVIMGDEIKLDSEARLIVSLPVHGRILLLKDSRPIEDSNGINRMEFVAKEKGSYRVEVYLPQLPGRVGSQPWIISNPIYLR